MSKPDWVMAILSFLVVAVLAREWIARCCKAVFQVMQDIWFVFGGIFHLRDDEDEEYESLSEGEGL